MPRSKTNKSIQPHIKYDNYSQMFKGASSIATRNIPEHQYYTIKAPIMYIT